MRVAGAGGIEGAATGAEDRQGDRAGNRRRQIALQGEPVLGLGVVGSGFRVVGKPAGKDGALAKFGPDRYFDSLATGGRLLPGAAVAGADASALARDDLRGWLIEGSAAAGVWRQCAQWNGTELAV